MQCFLCLYRNLYPRLPGLSRFLVVPGSPAIGGRVGAHMVIEMAIRREIKVKIRAKIKEDAVFPLSLP